MGCGSARVANKEAVDQAKIDQCVLDLKVARDRLKKYQNQQERTSELELQKAKELIAKKSIERAKLVLRQRKQRETLIMNAEKMLANVENQINNVETKQIQMDVMNNIKETNAILKQMNDLMPIEEVEAIMDENEEQTERLNEITGLLTQNMSKVDEDECEAEYEKMYREMMGGEEQTEQEQTEQEQEEPEEEESEQPQRVAMMA
ncbi:charged multivesicular body protein 6-A [Histomonas meleagridis]|uniref:charged multivesicular body protein 6-A n=1 Tax=Histomonas meleagridis TaxID=135588 RepID=UPI003559CCAE|nr:charged multivesicular body protein 6-A [Histomonas meleagridis]KAH0796463.1 charged multivesicular body protein 6-A [Histomonas meleagridis]